MKIVITGASGFVGQETIGTLLKSGAELLLVGRDLERLVKLYPDLANTGYEGINERAAGYDALVHLAVLNNDCSGSDQDFEKVNLTLLKGVVASAKAAQIPRFIYPSTLQASVDEKSSSYARSKYAAQQVLAKTDGILVTDIRMPAIYGSVYRGKLSILNKVPKWLRRPMFLLMASLKPTLDAQRLALVVMEAANSSESRQFVLSDRQEGNLIYASIKRLIDLLFVGFVVTALWWLLLATWIVIKLTSPGPGVFAQERVGRDGKIFTCYKFRTMTTGTRQVGTHEIGADSITGVGRFIRKTKVDELPQIWNILKNDLSLVGPRPCLPVQSALIEHRTRRGVLSIKGGITGWAQIKNVDMSNPKKLAKLDEEYINLRSILLDLKIIIATASGSGQGDKIGE